MRARNYLALTALAFAGCVSNPLHSSTAAQTGSGTSGGPPTVDLSVQALEDVNTSSETFGQTLHPSDYTGQVTAWYFGHST